MLQFINQFGYIGILLLIAIENIFPPIPSEVILTFGGFMTSQSSLNIAGVILSSTAGSVIGAIALYALGRWLSAEKWLRWLGGRWGRLLHLKKEDISRAAGWFSKRGQAAVFFCRFIPIVRSLISVPAGAAGMQMGKFLVLTAAGTFIWNTVLVCLGAWAGDSWETIVRYADVYSAYAVTALIAVSAVLFIVFLKRKTAKNSKS